MTRLLFFAAVCAALVAGGVYGFRYVKGIQGRNAFVEKVRVHFSAEVRKLGRFASDQDVRDIVMQFVAESPDVTAGADAVEVMRVLVEVDEKCRMKTPDSALDPLPVLDRGNVRNLAIRCVQPLELVGVELRLKAKGRPFSFAAWTYTTER